MRKAYNEQSTNTNPQGRRVFKKFGASGKIEGQYLCTPAESSAASAAPPVDKRAKKSDTPPTGFTESAPSAPPATKSYAEVTSAKQSVSNNMPPSYVMTSDYPVFDSTSKNMPHVTAPSTPTYPVFSKPAKTSDTTAAAGAADVEQVSATYVNMEVTGTVFQSIHDPGARTSVIGAPWLERMKQENPTRY